MNIWTINLIVQVPQNSKMNKANALKHMAVDCLEGYWRNTNRVSNAILTKIQG